MPVAASYDARLTARPRAGTALATLLQTGQPLNATGSSVAVPDPRASGLAAIDGDPGTAWTPRRDDFQPQLALNWIGRRWIDGLTLAVDADAPVRRPASVTISWPGGRREVELDEAGRARFPRIRTDRLVLRLTGSENAASIDDSGAASTLPVGIGEVRLRGLPFDPITLDPLERTWQCGTGPTVEVDGLTTETALVASAVELYDMRTVEAKPCTAELRVSLDAGENSVRALGSSVSTPDTLVMGGATEVAPPVPATVDGSSPVHQQVELATPSEGLVLRHNANDGWQATQGGTALHAIVVDGWQQGWLTTGRGDSVEVRFGPDRVYRWGVAIGGLLFLALVGLSLVPARRWAGPHCRPSDHGRCVRRSSSSVASSPGGSWRVGPVWSVPWAVSPSAPRSVAGCERPGCGSSVGWSASLPSPTSSGPGATRTGGPVRGPGPTTWCSSPSRPRSPWVPSPAPDP